MFQGPSHLINGKVILSNSCIYSRVSFYEFWANSYSHKLVGWLAGWLTVLFTPVNLSSLVFSEYIFIYMQFTDLLVLGLADRYYNINFTVSVNNVLNCY